MRWHDQAQYDLGITSNYMKQVYNTVQFGMRSIANQGPLVWNAIPINVKDFMQVKNSSRSSNILRTGQ